MNSDKGMQSFVSNYHHIQDNEYSQAPNKFPCVPVQSTPPLPPPPAAPGP